MPPFFLGKTPAPEDLPIETGAPGPQEDSAHLSELVPKWLRKCGIHIMHMHLAFDFDVELCIYMFVCCIHDAHKHFSDSFVLTRIMWRPNKRPQESMPNITYTGALEHRNYICGRLQASKISDQHATHYIDLAWAMSRFF